MLHPYSQDLQLSQVLSLNIEEVAAFFYQQSPFKESDYDRIERDVRQYLQGINSQFLHERDEPEERIDYMLAVVTYQFLAPILGIAVEEEKANFSRLMARQYGMKDPLAVHFAEEGHAEHDEEKSPAAEAQVISLNAIVEGIESERILRHKTPQGLRDRIYHEALKRLSRLEGKYTLEHHLAATGYVFVLCPAFGYDPDEEGLKDRYEHATEGHPRYVLLFPMQVQEEDGGQEQEEP